MRTSHLIGIVLVLSPLAYFAVRERPAGNEPITEVAARLEALDGQLAALAHRLDALEKAPSRPVVLSASPARREGVGDLAPSPSPSPGAGPAPAPDARWYLEQYVRSFDGDETGAEYYRLLVDAHALELVDALAALAVEPGRPVLLRLALVRMLARTSLRGDRRVLDALAAILRQGGNESLAQVCLQAWTRVGTADVLPQLEALVWELPASELRQRALQALAATAGEGTNAALLRLFATAPDLAASALLLQSLDASDLASALTMFERASHGEPPLRLAAAHRIGDFDDERFVRYVETWLGFETDQKVIEALGGAKQRQEAGAGWSAMQAAGPPNADPRRDDPKAWAPRDPQMGRQWLELQYPAADRLSGVRVYEVNSPGAVAEVQARDAAGEWHVLWRGRTNAGAKPLEITFTTTAFATRVLRLVLDTDRASGWNEIDAVEALGRAGAQFAKRATASSSYAQRSQPAVSGRPVEFRLR